MKKPSGGKRRWPYKVKRKYAYGSQFIPVVLSSDEERRVVRVRGGNLKVRLRRAAYAIVVNPKTGVARKARITRVVESRANREFAKRNVIVKGTIIETTAGRAIVTSRPGQDGVVNAVLVEE